VALKQNPKNVSALNNRAAAKIMLEDYKGAMDDLNKAIALDPKNSDAFNNRGRTKQALGDTEGACKDWNTAFDLGSTESKDMIIKFCK
jgi:Flp pilus assembly protein TadD